MKTILVSLFCLTSIMAKSQINFENDKAILNETQFQKPGVVLKQAKKNTSQPSLIFKAPLLFYKSVLSEQISASCEFNPTCSSFSMLAFTEFNFLKALLLTADRLTRCNGTALSETIPYLIQINDSKIMDYPDMYRVTH